MFQIYYQKKNNKGLFKGLEKRKELGLSNLQNYIPIYDSFFTTTKKNFNTFNLNQKYHIEKIIEPIKEVEHQHLQNDITMKKYLCEVVEYDKDGIPIHKMNKNIFFKCCPLLDPVKYMIGKYDDMSLCELPTCHTKNKDTSTTTTIHDKITRPNNASYVDGFFTYLTSQLKNTHGFLHGLDFYGSFLGIQRPFKVDVIDDLEYLYESNFFRKNNGVLFHMDDHPYIKQMNNSETRNYKERLTIHGFTMNDDDTEMVNKKKEKENEKQKTELSENIITLDDIKDVMTLDELFEHHEISTTTSNKEVTYIPENLNEEESLVFSYDITKSKHGRKERGNANVNTNANANAKNGGNGASIKSSSSSSGSSFSSRSSHTTESSDIQHKGNASETASTSTSTSTSTSNTSSSSNSFENISDDILFANINNFPVELVCLECCDHTFDSLFTEGTLSSDELTSALFQIIIILITYQKVFSLTHNDLHTNNIMYQKTDIKYLYYIYNGIRYRVPTHGRIFKIIDYGRSIYKYKGKVLCSDSFHPDGDAATQYNFGIYYNEKKKMVGPNESFDLCRLGCSLIDYFVDDIGDIPEISEKDPLVGMILSWCNDDKQRNILYKKNGEERYKEFKLYKMISRNVHQHKPSVVIKNSVFNTFIISKKKWNKATKQKHNTVHMNIDELPCYC